MSGKLDQSLDQIMQDTKPAGGRGRGGRKPRPVRNAKSKAKAAIAAPTAGVQKSRAATKPAASAAATLTKTTPGDSKIIVSNLPEDVTETQIKDYFQQTIGGVKKVLLTYGANGRSRGVATIIFRTGEGGQKAVKQLDGVKVDNKPMKVELIVGASQVSAPAPPKGLADRMAKPKSAANDKTKAKTNGAATTNGAAKTKNASRKNARNSRPKKKTADELDAEMVDYFGTGENATTNGAAPQTAAAPVGETAMVDEVL